MQEDGKGCNSHKHFITFFTDGFIFGLHRLRREHLLEASPKGLYSQDIIHTST